MITPQNTIQSTDQNPVPAPRPYALSVPPNGAFQTVTPRRIVRIAPRITACHADSRNTASISSRAATGTNAINVLPSTECAGSRTWVNAAAEWMGWGISEPAMTGLPHVDVVWI